MKDSLILNYIKSLSDSQAFCALDSIIEGIVLLKTFPAIDCLQLKTMLDDSFGVTPVDGIPSKGDIARQALILFSEIPEYYVIIDTFRNNSQELLCSEVIAQPYHAEKFSFIEITSIVTVALVVLSTKFRFEKDKNGKTSFLIEKNSIGNAALIKFVQLIQRCL